MKLDFEHPFPPLYGMPLVDWICLGERKDTIAEVTKAIRQSRLISTDLLKQIKPENKSYMLKQLREQSTRQFADVTFIEPLSQVINNAIDSRPRNYSDDSYNVIVKVGRKKVSVTDNGTGMGLEDIISLLVTPFSTNKDGMQTIGKHGTGFISTYLYCLREPKKVSLKIETANGNEAYTTYIYGKSKDVADLWMGIEKKQLESNKRGTSFLVDNRTFDKKLVKDKLTTTFENIDIIKANIYINDVLINEKYKQGLCQRPVHLRYDGGNIAFQLGLRVNTDGVIQLTSEGRQVKRDLVHASGATVFFPNAITVTEGWDDFKMDDNYFTCAREILRMYKDIIEKEPKWKPDAIYFVPKLLTSLAIKEDQCDTQVRELLDVISDNKEYIFHRSEMNVYEPFFGKILTNNAFTLNSEDYAFWKKYKKSSKEFFDTFPCIYEGTLQDLHKMIHDNSLSFKAENIDAVISTVAKHFLDDDMKIEIRSIPISNTKPFLFLPSADKLLINAAHPYIVKEGDLTSIYGAIQEFRDELRIKYLCGKDPSFTNSTVSDFRACDGLYKKEKPLAFNTI